MSTTPGAGSGASGSRDRRRLILAGVIIIVVIALIVAVAGWYYMYGGTAPEAPTIDNALQQLLPTDPPE